MITTSSALDKPKRVSFEQIQEFRANGHVLTRDVLAPSELSQYRSAIVEAADKYNTEKRNIEDRDTYGKAFLQIINLWEVDQAVREFVFAKRFARMAADLLGVDNVRLYHDQALFKEPGGGPTPWHQDQYYWPVDTPNTITMWMPLVDIDVDMGMLTFATGSHKNGCVFEFEISDESEGMYEEYVANNKFPVTRANTMNAGDATWHYGHTIHKAPGNKSDIMREVMTIIYVADGSRITQPRHKWQANDHQKFLMGRPVGQLVEGSLTPLML